MPHGRPEEGVKKTGFALVTLKKPLEFNHEDNDPVDILITMAAVDAKRDLFGQHIRSLAPQFGDGTFEQIGRASCRERV